MQGVDRALLPLGLEILCPPPPALPLRLLVAATWALTAVACCNLPPTSQCCVLLSGCILLLDLGAPGITPNNHILRSLSLVLVLGMKLR